MLNVCMFDISACSPGLPASSNRRWVTMLKPPSALAGAIESDANVGERLGLGRWASAKRCSLVWGSNLKWRCECNKHLVVAPLDSDVKYHSYDRLDSSTIMRVAIGCQSTTFSICPVRHIIRTPSLDAEVDTM